jgi:glycosyltransferase involved in cell wall biosynthesis
MAKTACQGRGVPEGKVSVVQLGVDVEKFKPADGETRYAQDVVHIPVDRKIIYFSGHMEERKGVAVLMRAAERLYEQHQRRDFHFLILGNRHGEEHEFLDMLGDSGVSKHVTFGGYRNDVEKIMPSCAIGAIASTGWDSFTVSSLEMAACGLPLMVSRLQGLVETIEEGVTGLSFTAGDDADLANKIMPLLEDPVARNAMGLNARKRVVSAYTREIQIDRLVNVMNEVAG